MAKYLRDEQLFNLTLDEEKLSELAEVCAQRGLRMPEYRPVEGDQPATVLLFYTIRFDQKGYRVFNSDELAHYFNTANEVERIIFDLRSATHISSNGNVGSYANLRLDNNEKATSFLTVDSDDEEWVNGTFNAIKDVLNKCKNRHKLFRNPLVDILLQVFGLIAGFALSLWGASLISPNLAIENAFLISFLLVLIIFSNLWGQIQQTLQVLLYRIFPNIEFLRPKKDRLHWLMQTLVGGIVVAFALYLLGIAFSYMGDLLSVFIQSGT
jgi:hypothetical protein